MIHKEIGGFFELELPKAVEYHSSAIRLNKARSALYYLLKAKKIKKIFLPYYMCYCILEPILDLKINYEFYNIDDNFYPIFNRSLGNDEYLLYINYFGICSRNVEEITHHIKNVIVDNTQAFFEQPIKNIDTIYSPRKFFGVPDGGYLYTNVTLNEKLSSDYSYSRLNFLAKRIDCCANDSYILYQKNEELLINEEPKRMSKLTQRILQSIDYENAKNRRNDNFFYIHNQLKEINEITLNINSLNGPMVYPFFIRQEDVKKRLIERNIYVATYWKEVLQYTDSSWFEHELTRYLIPIPIDQRYNEKEMTHIIETIKYILF
ncbi:hypothetical protein BAMA_14670 [Bacillus manliponensis]|uniref:DegT/DnrJ/EryC1/StrS aminotransferase family protein n=1 Tax=Bacillus manliponensis TaxID=574376 RepID=A0A073K2B6_9BACI|nr:hypothetical protein [Bacillus manliponensis]KEK20650.1 hypothetical protein BAMA_14670 [Bacillus manliponensis]